MSTDTDINPETKPVALITPAHDKKLSPSEILTIVVLVFSAFVAFLSEMVVGVALPRIMAGSAGLAMLIAILSANSTGDGPEAVPVGAGEAFTAGAVIALAGVVAALFIPRQKRSTKK